MPEELDFKNSLQLLSLHAFRRSEPPEDYKKLSHEVVRHVGGLSLALEWLGSFLVGKNEEEWEDTLERLKNIHDDKKSGKSIKSYDDKVFRKLMISYEKLGDSEKTIFLDVACHFIGREVEEAISIWKACKLSPRLAIKELIQKHLLKFVKSCDQKELRMHDLLQDMGRRIVMEYRSGDPSKRCRLWYDDEIFKRFQKLKVLSLNYCWHLSKSPDFSWFPRLQRLDLRGCSLLLKLPDLSKLKRLRQLDISECENLEEIHGLNGTKSLEELNASSCEKLKELSDLSNLKRLRELNIRGCVYLKEIHGLEGIESSEELNASNCKSLKELSDLSKLERLKELNISGCEYI
ncbi:disease resistance protein Roq1-like [Macadamia integrifolia]|uniref:disease resistance protein Roq1-like n=1 Tax=Macadamia integrifolia TaxID=60698 RepID=UPI001C4FB52C|nr:disease resistance protein Roq1-like [Macadamia integrifolia]